MHFAPIALFAFNRPMHLHRVLKALAANELANESHLTIFCDGPRHADEKAQTESVRDIAAAAAGFASLTVRCRKDNAGVEKNMIDGITTLLSSNDNIIVLEDDLLTSPWFLRYMNEALGLYADDSRIASIHAYAFPYDIHSSSDTFFLRQPGCWGWGTWKRAWKAFNPDARQLLQALADKKLLRAFDVDGAYPYVNMLKHGTWDVCWYASNFLLERLTLHPARSMIQNIGMDGSGTHCGKTTAMDISLTDHPLSVMPMPIMENIVMKESHRRYLNELQGAQGGISNAIRKKIGLFLDRSFPGLGKE
ncbi:MAG: glycosyltransferase family 2 protein [Candidatus Accumulibacter sp.]|jgi:hypothetical protein|nr:glycosyltransferase family 2 protein [Accumulibacter sp.]